MQGSSVSTDRSCHRVREILGLEPQQLGEWQGKGHMQSKIDVQGIA